MNELLNFQIDVIPFKDPPSDVCEDCGSTDNVELQLDPFSHEINGDNKLYYMCKNCVKSSCMEI